MFLDLAVAIFVAIWSSNFYLIPFDGMFLFWILALTLLPDIDILLELAYKTFTGKNLYNDEHDHRDILHYPLLYILLGVIIISLVSNSTWVVIFILISLAHYLHDSVGIGWGVYWLYPFSNRRFSFLYQYDIFKHKIKPYKLIYSWNREEFRKMSKTYGDPHWVKNIYFGFHPYAMFELLVFVIALGWFITKFL